MPLSCGSYFTNQEVNEGNTFSVLKGRRKPTQQVQYVRAGWEAHLKEAQESGQEENTFLKQTEHINWQNPLLREIGR